VRGKERGIARERARKNKGGEGGNRARRARERERERDKQTERERESERERARARASERAREREREKERERERERARARARERALSGTNPHLGRLLAPLSQNVFSFLPSAKSSHVLVTRLPDHRSMAPLCGQLWFSVPSPPPPSSSSSSLLPLALPPVLTDVCVRVRADAPCAM
jgi:hypothetical protein